MAYRIVGKLLLILIPSLLIGCGGSTPTSKSLDMGGEDANAVTLLIEDLNDAIGNPKKLTEMFMAKSADTSKMRGCSFSIVGKPTVTGTSATATVRVEKMGAKASVLGEVQWSFEKAGDKWKIKDAPLP